MVLPGSLDEKRLRRAPALRRLLTLQRLGRSLFQADRGSSAGTQIFPSIPRVDMDPERPRGYWEPRIGFIHQVPLVREVFASPLVPVLIALSQHPDGNRCFHVDEFGDGAIALTLGELHNAGAFEETLFIADRCGDLEPLDGYCVNVLPRSAFDVQELGRVLQGTFTSPEPVPVRDRVRICAGDVRLMAELVGHRLPRWSPELVRAAPFTGPFSEGGHLQFDPISGELLSNRRVPTAADRTAAMAIGEARSFRSARRAESSMAIDWSRSAGESGSLRKALDFIENHCTRSITVAEVAAAARMSSRSLHAAFRDALKTAPLKYAAERRLEVAERLLTETRISIAEVAERCGYAEQSSLTRSMRRLRGVTPVQARRRAAGLDKNGCGLGRDSVGAWTGN